MAEPITGEPVPMETYEMNGNYIAMIKQDAERLLLVYKQNQHLKLALYKHELDTYLRKQLGLDYAEITAKLMEVMGLIARQGQFKCLPETLCISMQMAIANCISFHTPDYKTARTTVDFFGQVPRAARSMSQYNDILKKLGDTLEPDEEAPDDIWLTFYSPAELVKAAETAWPNESTRTHNLRQLLIIMDMHKLYYEKEELSEYIRREIKPFQPEPAAKVARALNEEQLAKVCALVLKTQKAALAEVKECLRVTRPAEETVKTLSLCIDYVLMASLYPAPGERFEPGRRDWYCVSFQPNTSAMIRIHSDNKVMLHYKEMTKVGKELLVDLSVMAPSFAEFCSSYKTFLQKFDKSQGHLLYKFKVMETRFQPITTGHYSVLLQDLWPRYEADLGFDMKTVCGTGCNAARHSLKRAKRGPPLTQQDKEDIAQQGHSRIMDGEY